MRLSAGHRELVGELMQDAAEQQVTSLHEYQIDAIIRILHSQAPSLLTSPAAIGLFAHTYGDLEFAWGSQRKVLVSQTRLPGEVLYFLSNANCHTIYDSKETGLAYERLFVYAQLAFLGYNRFKRPRVRDQRGNELTSEATSILADKGLTTRDGRMNKELCQLLAPAMLEIFHNRYFSRAVPASDDQVRQAVMTSVMEKYYFVS